jgi:hypothetical protein
MVLPDYVAIDVLQNPDIREGIKVYGNWPTVPQLYVNGELVGGSDIVTGMLDRRVGHLGIVEPGKPPRSRSSRRGRHHANALQGRPGGRHSPKDQCRDTRCHGPPPQAASR